MDKRKALFFDIDGTILSEKTNQIPESCIRAIKDARNAGHLTFLNTGRTRACVPSRVVNVGFDGILCGCGTEVIYHGKSIFHKGISKELCVDIARAVKEANLASILEGDIFYYEVPDRPDFEFLKNGGNLADRDEMTLIFDWKPEDVFFDKFVIWADEYSDVERVFSVVRDEMDIIYRGKDFYEIVPKGFDKANAIKTIQDIFKIDLEDTYVFGDSSNDLAMFKYSPNAIAMKDHDSVLDPYTTLITDTVENDGIEKALIKLGLTTCKLY